MDFEYGYLNGLLVDFYKSCVFLSLRFFELLKNTGLDQMQQHAAFHLGGLHCFPENRLGVSICGACNGTVGEETTEVHLNGDNHIQNYI